MTQVSKQLPPDELAVSTALFAFAQNFGFDWHASFVKWLRESLMAEFDIGTIQTGIVKVMQGVERPWSPYGAIRSECRLLRVIAESAEEEMAQRKRDEEEAKRVKEADERWLRMTTEERVELARKRRERVQAIVGGLVKRVPPKETNDPNEQRAILLAAERPEEREAR